MLWPRGVILVTTPALEPGIERCESSILSEVTNSLYYGGAGIRGGLVQYDWFRVDAEIFYSRTKTAILMYEVDNIRDHRFESY